MAKLSILKRIDSGEWACLIPMRTARQKQLAVSPAQRKGMAFWSIAVGITLVFSTLLMIEASAHAGDPDSEKFSEETAQHVAERRKKIKREIEQLADHPWAGEYYAGDGTAVNIYLWLAPESGFVFEWHGCLGLYDINHGTIGFDGKTIHLDFKHPNEREGFQGLAEALIPIEWGDRRYLVPPDEMGEFANDVNACLETRQGSRGGHLLRRGDHELKASGYPILPEEFAAYLLEDPIDATITDVVSVKEWTNSLGWNIKEVTVDLDVGQQNGLFPGMRFYVYSPEYISHWLTVSELSEDTAHAVVTQTVEEDLDEVDPQPGWRLTTEHPWFCGDETTETAY
ncbi:hypothetical protein IC757_03575 [Wenzhouxiangella sp. AB-CW3]|uniref:hypothetical protein n=1 Tax=Wenzhouxiangella sp. AB-CW3 TaxID=2771012 RepID=UPI00168B4DF3|nr:hypothetical protein [Wenzhouxiangella sp. AB-CW3]QOC23244.1 hypothetical protein IC757_03575 [Wenzhouxiangella sp. AB-CW3]